jgi:polyhydroxyalkanoate synthase subunit PhaC
MSMVKQQGEGLELARWGTRAMNLMRRAGQELPAVGQTPADVVHEENKWRLLRFRRHPEGPRYKTPLVLVPSLINRWYVLDLMPGKSLVEFLVGRGHDVFIIDWGTPGDEDRYLDFDTICDTYIGRAVRKAARLAGTEEAHVLGYCLGGTLATIYAARRPEHVASLIALAAPVKFDPEGLLAVWTRSPDFDLDGMIDACGNVPWPLMQAAFNMLRPTMMLSKAQYMVDRAWDDEFLDGFFALERWGNDNVSFPGECYRRYITELYREDQLAKGTFALSGRPVHMEDIRCPTLTIAFHHDNIVPLASALALHERVGASDKQLMQLNGGHVGAVVSRKASGGLWPGISEWMAARDG